MANYDFRDATPISLGDRPPLAELDEADLALFRRAGSSLVFDQEDLGARWLSGLSTTTQAVGEVLCGRALTVDAVPGDNVALRHAIDAVRAGDVVVVAGRGYLGRALVGEILVGKVQARGGVGMVIDGAFRDHGAIVRMGFPVLARGVAVRRATKLGGGGLHQAVAVRNEVVFPGDVVIADGDGVVCLPARRLPEARQRLQAAMDTEQARVAAAAAGELDLGVGPNDTITEES